MKRSLTVTEKDYDLVIIGAGSGGLTAAGFAAQLGAKVALVEKDHIGGDCTWTGCVPSKALLKAAKVAHEIRTASQYGVGANPPVVEMGKVRDYVRSAIQQVYQFETPEELQRQGVDVVMGAARFLDSRTITASERAIRSKTFLLTTGAKPAVPPIAGLNEVPFLTYEQIFDNDRLPAAMVVVGGGPIGIEMSQAYQRLGASVSVVAPYLLPKEEPEAREVMQRVLEREGIRFVQGRATSARKDGDDIVIATDREEARGDLLLVASGRRPTVGGLDLEKAGVAYSEKGILVDDQLRTNVKNIYAAGDVLGGFQFTHFAGWQAFQAVRNALLPGSSSGFTDLVPWTTFTDPEVAHVGPTEAQAREKFGDNVKICRWEMSRTDRAVCENDTDGFIKVIAKKDGTILGATIVCGRGGETLTEFIVAIKQNMKVADLAGAIHAYPTYSTAIQQLAADMAIENLLSGASGSLIRGLSKIIR
jgi:pyruvate/2-oxoglutarate dehydrogenase complex dihydrolipoamide dehydrogenase (E3) component